jgi:hypothetical protein
VSYRAISAAEVQCQAASTSPEAALLLDEKQALGRLFSAAPAKWQLEQHSVTSLQQKVFKIAAVEARNRSAAEALRLYYRLAQAEAGQTVLAESFSRLSDGLDRSRRLIEQGFLPSSATAPLEQQHTQLEVQQVTLDQTIGKINAGLKASLQFDEPGDWKLWPRTDLTIPVEPLDIEAAVSIAHANNARLYLLQTLRDNFCYENASVIRGLLGQLNPMLGNESGADALGPLAWIGDWLHPHQGPDRPADYAARRRQLDELIGQQKRSIRLQVTQAIESMNFAARRSALSRTELLNWERQVETLERSEVVGQADYGEVLEARLSLLRARSDLTERMIDWHLAHVDLREVQGMLSAECGYPLPQDQRSHHYAHGAACRVCQ